MDIIKVMAEAIDAHRLGYDGRKWVCRTCPDVVVYWEDWLFSDQFDVHAAEQALLAASNGIKAEGLRDAANVLSEYEPKSPTPTYDAMCVNWLLERAEKIENGEL